MTDSAIHRIRHLQTQRDELLERADLLAERCDILQASTDAYLSDLNDAREALPDVDALRQAECRIGSHLLSLNAFDRAATILDALDRSQRTTEVFAEHADQDLRRLLKQIAEAPETT